MVAVFSFEEQTRGLLFYKRAEIKLTTIEQE